MALVCIVLGKRYGDGSTEILPMGHESDRYSSQVSNVSLVIGPFVSHDFMAGVKALSRGHIELKASILKVSRTKKFKQIYLPVSNSLKAA